MQPWQAEELENLVSWMEQNHERLRGRPADWINRVKDDIFPDNQGFKHITAKKVKDKYSNMKRAWKDAKVMQEKSGFGPRKEDCDTSVNGMALSTRPALPPL